MKTTISCFLRNTPVLLVATMLFGSSADRVTAQEKQEPPKMGQRFAQQDKNGDGRLARDETTGLMNRYFDRNDINKDGFLDAQELQQLAERLRSRQSRTRKEMSISDEQVNSRIPKNVQAQLNIAYRKGNDAWQLDLFKPKANMDSPRPAIVFVHGGGWRSGDKRRASFLNPAIEYAGKGYVTITVNYRLDSEILPCVQDVKCAVRWLRAHAKEYNVDPHRIGAFGNSAGAHLVTMLGLSHTEPALEGDGPWKDFVSTVQAVAASATPALPVFGSGSDTVKKLVAPMTYVNQDAPPMLLFHDEGDKTVPIKNSDQLVKALKEVGATDITYKRYNNQSGHGVFARNSKETTPALEAFFARTLQTGTKKMDAKN